MEFKNDDAGTSIVAEPTAFLVATPPHQGDSALQGRICELVSVDLMARCEFSSPEVLPVTKATLFRNSLSVMLSSTTPIGIVLRTVEEGAHAR